MAGDQSYPAPAVPWSEWTDVELNAEKWDSPKNGTDGRFVDPEPLAMPPSLQELLHDWQRGSILKNMSSNPVMFTPSNVSPDFTRNNKHILHSEFVRWFVSTIMNLRYAGRDGLRVEGESPAFVWLYESLPWQGWMHVYSLNKAGNAATEHQPVVNPNGKYVVRLYFMGFWRRFIVDDMIPVDKDGIPLLPRTENNFELWPMLLAKAMMKLASLSWTNRREINDFYPVSCLTGWICLPLDSRSLSPNEKWDLLARYVEEESCGGEAPPSEPIENTDYGKIRMHDPRPNVAIFANRANESLAGDAVPVTAPCPTYPVYIDKLRNIVQGSLQQLRWKAYRWFDWALRHGKAENDLGAGFRSLKLTNPFENIEGRELALPDIGVWEDFGKVAPHLEDILIFYKPSDFEYCARVSDVLRTTSSDSQVHVSAKGSRVKSQATGGYEGKKAQASSVSGVTSAPTFLREFKWQRNVSACKSDPLPYMLVDSVDTKFFLIDFCSMPQADRPLSRSYLIVERYNLLEKSSYDDPAALVKTFSAGATIFEAGPGRHVFRVLFRAGHSYFVRILSDTMFHVGDRFRVQDLMSSESDRIDAIVKNTSNRLSAAFQEFGGPGHATHIRAFYKSYMPREEDTLRSNVDKLFIKDIHRLFVEELAKLVRGTFTTVETEAICHALRVFFLNPAIGVTARCDEPNYRTAEEDEYGDSWLVRERAAVRIQSFFRMILVKCYKMVHDPSNVKHPEVAQTLRKVADLFNYTKRESAANSLIRKIIYIRSPLYPCHEDTGHVFNVEEWKGVARNVQPGQWTPLLRVAVDPPSAEDTVHACIDFATGLPRQIIRVVNNETCREVTRVVNKIPATRYPYVVSGYTVIGYGWSDGSKFKELEWSVRVTTVKGQPTFRTRTSGSRPSLLGTKPGSLLVQELSTTYVPNASNIIGKWIVAVSADCLLSFRISTSYSMVETMIKVVDKDGNVMCVTKGGSCLILPAVCLSFADFKRPSASLGEIQKIRTSSRSKSLVSDSQSAKDVDETTVEYYVRAYVLNDSWPLGPAEWVVAKEAEARGTVYDPWYGRSSISKRGTRSRVQSDAEVAPGGSSPTISQHPLCRLQILTDVGTKVQVERDRRREIEVAGMKGLWEVAEPGRLLRGRKLRDEFLRENSVAVTTPTDYSSSEIGAEVSTAEIRSLKPPANLSPVLTAWNVESYVLEDEEEVEPWVKTENDEEMLRNQRQINSIEFEQAQEAYVEEEAALIQEQRQRYYTLFDSYVKKGTYWKSLADTACEKRDRYAVEVKSALSARAGKNVKDTRKNKKKAT